MPIRISACQARAWIHTPASSSGVDAVSAVLQKAVIQNDYVTVSELER